MTSQPSGSPDTTGSATPPVSWAGWRSLADVIGVYVAAQVLGALLVLTTGSIEDVPLGLLIVVSPLALGLITVVWMQARYRAGLAALWPVGRRRLADVGVGLGVGLAAFVVLQQVVLRAVLIVLETLDVDLPTVQDTFRVVAQDRATAPLLVLSALVLAPVAEELLFRSVLFRGLRARRGFWVAALTSAAAFTLPHLGDGSGPLADLIVVVGILPLGVLFAGLMERRRSLLACVVAHATYNAGGVAVLLLAPSTLA